MSLFYTAYLKITVLIFFKIKMRAFHNNLPNLSNFVSCLKHKQNFEINEAYIGAKCRGWKATYSPIYFLTVQKQESYHNNTALEDTIKHCS